MSGFQLTELIHIFWTMVHQIWFQENKKIHFPPRVLCVTARTALDSCPRKLMYFLHKYLIMEPWNAPLSYSFPEITQDPCDAVLPQRHVLTNPLPRKHTLCRAGDCANTGANILSSKLTAAKSSEIVVACKWTDVQQLIVHREGIQRSNTTAHN